MRERTVHIVLGAVSGTGKSFVARLIAESVAIEFGLPLCFSLTAGNRPGMECAAKLKARRVDLAYVVSTGRAVCLDPMIETVVERGRSVVIDSCARLYPALFDCLRYDAVVLGLRDSGFAVQFHVVMTGGETNACQYARISASTFFAFTSATARLSVRRATLTRLLRSRCATETGVSISQKNRLPRLTILIAPLQRPPQSCAIS